MHKKDPVPALPAGPEDYQEMINLMMAKDRNERFRDAESLLHYVARSTRQGMFKSVADFAEASDFDVTGTPQQQVTRVELAKRRPLKLRAALTAVALLCAAAYGVLISIERRMLDTEVPRTVPAEMTMGVISDDTLPSNPAVDGGLSVQPDKVADALRWLETHSLNESHLTAPPKDNAYYYYSHLLQMDPADEVARQGLLQIAARYAILAEREIADGNHEQARSYFAIGFQVDPENTTLHALNELAAPAKRGMLVTLSSVFK